MGKLTLGSLFDGIGGFPLAAQRNGIETLWASEIESNCISITKRHFPNVEHLGDLTKIDGAEIAPVDIVSFGSPCQDLSVAGGQKGMKQICPNCGEEFDIKEQENLCPNCGAEIEKTRSGLFVEAVRIIYEMRGATNGEFPKFAIWENVPGAFSSNKGEDFRTVIEEITKTKISMPNSGRWATAGMVRSGTSCGSVAWRQLDAQFWGVPQRRKRIFLVADFRGERADEILFECESVLGYIEQSQKERERTSVDSSNGARTSSGDSYEIELPKDLQGVFDIAHANDVIRNSHGAMPTLQARMGTGGNQIPLIPDIETEETSVDFGRTSDRIRINAQKSATLQAGGGGAGAKTGLYLLDNICPVEFIKNGGFHGQASIASPMNVLAEKSQTLMAGKCADVMQAISVDTSHADDVARIDDISPAIQARDYKGGKNILVQTMPINDATIHGNANGFGIGENEDPSPTLTGRDRHGVISYGVDTYNQSILEETAKSITAAATDVDHVGGVIAPEQHVYENSSHAGYKEGCGTLRASGGDCGGGSENLVVFIEKLNLFVRYILRKLTPRECERLQGFPDDWTKYSHTGAEIKDTPRYVAAGNSLAVPCAERIFKGIIAVLERYDNEATGGETK